MQEKFIKGVILDEQVELTLDDICRVCDQHTEWVVELVNEGVLEPIGNEPIGNDQHQWRFSGPNLKKARTAMRLERDLGLNLEGIALALELMEELTELRERLYRYEVENTK